MKKTDKILGFDKEGLKQWALYWMLLGGGLFVLIFLITSTLIGVDVRERCLAAKSRYGGDCVEALMATLDDEDNSLRERNYAIWALGQMGDNKALPTVKKYYTGVIPDKEPYNSTLSQYEMRKAIKLLEGGFNATHLVWKPDSLE